MTHANGSKQREAGKTRESLEDYDVERAIRVVQELGEGLIEATKHAKHHFRREWLDQLVARYRERPGKPIVHLSDLPDQVIPTLSADVRKLLRPYWEKLVSGHGSEWGSQHFRCMWDIMRSGRASRWSSLRLWRKFSAMTGLRIDDLEQYVVAIRAANTGTSRVNSRPKLPFNLATPEGARLFGYRGDVAYDTSAFNNKDLDLHKDYRTAILKIIGNVPFTTSRFHDGPVYRTNVDILVTMVTSVGGLDNTQKQKFASNPLPSWLFLAEDNVLTSCQRALWDAEGSPTRDALKLGQSVHVSALTETPIAGCRKTRISAFSAEARELISTWPPLLLVSSSLMLRLLGIVSYLAPLGVEQTSQGKSAVWMLYIYRTKGMRLFEQKVGFLSSEKRQRLHRMNSLHKPKSSPPSFFSKVLITAFPIK